MYKRKNNINNNIILRIRLHKIQTVELAWSRSKNEWKRLPATFLEWYPSKSSKRRPKKIRGCMK